MHTYNIGSKKRICLLGAIDSLLLVMNTKYTIKNITAKIFITLTLSVPFIIFIKAVNNPITRAMRVRINWMKLSAGLSL